MKTFQSKMTKARAYRAWEYWKIDNNELYHMLLQECELCGTKEFLTINHKDGDKANNELSNLECLCWSCHSKWQAKNLQVKYRKPIRIYFIKEEPKEKTVAQIMKEYKWEGGKWVRR